MSEQEKFGTWGIVDLMGHLRLAGYVTEEERFGAKCGRVDVPRKDDSTSTHYFGGSSLYLFTPTTEEIARTVAVRNEPAPVHPWELPQLKAPETTLNDLEDGGTMFDDDDDVDPSEIPF